VIFEFISYVRRARRYREIANLITGVITHQTQERVEKTLQDAYQKSIAQGATPEDAKAFNQRLIDQINELLAKENGTRIRQWTEAILEAEEKALSGRSG
jgi:hypothetical protein